MRTLVTILITLAIVGVGLWALWVFYVKKKLMTSSLYSEIQSFDPSSLLVTPWGGVVSGKQLIGNTTAGNIFQHSSTGKFYSLNTGKPL